MRISCLGHAAFALTSDNGKTIICDPFEPNCYDGALGYPPINRKADVVTMSHTTHPDHSGAKSIMGNPQIVSAAGRHTAQGFDIVGIPVFHDGSQGRERGNNIIFVMTIDGLKVAHLGDLGHELSPAQLRDVGPVDVVLVPVGGHFTIDAKQAGRVAESIAAMIVVPMHYKTPLLNFPLTTVEDFLRGKKNVKKLDSTEVTVSRKDLPASPEIWALKYPGQ